MAFERPSRAGVVLYASTWPATNVFMPAVIGAAIIRQDETKPAICVEELHSPSWHFLVAFHPIAAPPGHAAPPPSSVMNLRRLTRSPRRRGRDGMATPIALAVLRLSTNSNFPIRDTTIAGVWAARWIAGRGQSTHPAT